MRGSRREFQKIKLSRPLSGRTPSKKVLLHLYAKEGKSIREIGETLNCTKDMIARALKAYGIKARTNASRSRLRTIELSTLEPYTGRSDGEN